MMAEPTSNQLFISSGLTTLQFQNAIERHIYASKPDPLLKDQVEKLQVQWEHKQYGGCGGDGQIQHQPPDCEQPHPINDTNLGDHTGRWTVCGTLTLSSEYISVSIHVNCRFNTQNCKTNSQNSTSIQVNRSIETSTDKQEEITPNYNNFDNEFYIQLTVSAKLASTSEHNSSTKMDEKTGDCKDRATKRKLRAGMIKRLKSDHFVKKLLIDDGDCDTSKVAHSEKRGTDTTMNDCNMTKQGLPLCEALIQQNKSSSSAFSSATQGMGTNGGYELEERVNVDENSLEAIRKAILSHAEDNLDVLELLLSMPYLPRSGLAGDGNMDNADQSASTKTLQSMAERAYLRLLEDAMFDACEKEGEDDLLDDLNISDRRCGDGAMEKNSIGKSEQKETQSKKLKQ